MIVKEKTAIYRIISVFIVAALLVGVVPLGQISGAAQDTEDKYFSVQVVNGGVMSVDSADIECSFSNTDGTLTGSGKTDSNGIWKTDYVIGTSYEGDNDFTFTVGENAHTETVDLTTAQAFLVFDASDNSFSWADEAVTAVKLSGIEEIADIENLANGVSKSVLAFGLPVVIDITTVPETQTEAQIEWDVDACSYDPVSKTAQSFVVNGVVVLPENVVNSDNISLDVSVKVSVLSADNAVFTKQPENAELKVGDKLTLSAEAESADADSYQWFKIIDGVESQLLSQTKKTLVIDAVTIDDAGEYLCKVTGENGNVISSAKAVVTVSKHDTEISLETQPTSPQSRPVAGGIKLVVNGVPSDYNGEINFYVNGELVIIDTIPEFTFEPDADVDFYTFYAELVGDDKYSQSVSEEITFELTKGVQSALEFSDMLPSEFTFGEYSAGFYVKTIGGNGDGEVKISIVDEKYPDGTDGYKIAQVDSSGRITIYKAGSFVVTAQKLGDDNYNNGEVISSEVITVKRAAQTGFAFDSEEASFVYNTGDNTLVLAADGGEGDGDITYSVPADCDVVEVVEAQTGKLKVLKAGTVTVTATKEADECYEAVTAECVLTVEKADQTIEFEQKADEGDTLSVAYGAEFSNKAVEIKVIDAVDGLGYGTGKIIYYVKDGVDIVTSVDENGKLTINSDKTGTVIIAAYKEACENYNASPEITYTVEIYHKKYNDRYYKEIIGDQINTESTWYTSDVKIVPPDGYKLGFGKYIHNTWYDEITISNEGENNGVDVYLGELGLLGIAIVAIITPSYHIPNELLKIDKSAPENIKITYENENWYDDILDAILFGNHENTLKFTVDAEDKYSGVSEIAWEFDADVTDNESYKTLNGSASGDELTVNGTAASASFSIEFTDVEEVRGHITVTVTDVAGWTSELKDAKKIIFDARAPYVNMEFVSGTFSKFIDLDTKKQVLEEGENTARVYYGETAVKLSVKDVTFTKDNTVVKVNDEVLACEWTEKNGVYSTVLSSSVDGVYKISLETTDALGRVNALENTVIIDNTVTAMRSEIISETSAVSDGVYTDMVKVRLYVLERNFNAENLKVEFLATDISGNAVLLDKDYKAYLENADNWLYDGTEYYAEVEIDKNAVYSITAVYSDISGDAEYTVPNVVIDNEPAYDVTISYDESNLKNKISEAISNITSNYFNPNVDVVVTAKDNISGVDYIKLSYTKAENAPEGTTDSFELEAYAESFERSEDNKTVTAVFSVPADVAQNVQLSGYFKAAAKDKAGNSSDEVKDETNLIIVDTVSPECAVEYSIPERAVDSEMLDVESIENGSTAKLYYKNSATLNIEIDEANFVAEDVKISVSKDGGDFEPIEPENWSSSGNVNTAAITLEGEGNYIVAIEYTDLSENAMINYESYEIIIDGTAPKVSAQIITGENTSVTEEVYYNGDVALELSAVENNFRASDISFELLTAKDINGNDVELAMSLEEIKAYFNDSANWSVDESNPDVNKATLKLTDDAIYAVTVSYTDLACNAAEQTATANAIVDTAAPDNITFEYSESKFTALINDITFGYYNPEVTVTVKANDATSGVEKINWIYDRAVDSSESNVQSLNGIVSSLTRDENDKSLYTGSFTLPLEQAQQLDGYLSVAATDKVGNGAEKTDSETRIVVDTIAPEMTVDYLDVKSEIKPESGESVVDPDTGSIEATDSTEKSKLYFKDFATLVFKVTDINFHPEDINSEDALYKALGCSITVTKDAGEAYSIAPEQWSAVEGEADTYTGSITLEGDGNYFVTVEYMDRSHNEMERYTSHEIIVDSVLPEVSAEITHTDDVDGEDKIYNGAVTLAITVTEKNFRAEDLCIELLTAKDINSNDVSLSKLGMTAAEIKTYFAQAENWNAVEGKADTYTASLKLSDDAAYSFEASYTDLSTNKSAENAKANAVVDTAAPTGIEFSYSASVFQEVTKILTFGYYNPDVTVTITAKDVISGVKEIAWVYNRAEGASTSNVEKLSGIAENLTADATDKSVYTATLTLPLDAAQQLDGHIFAEVTDNAENSSSANDDATRVIVDTISPTMSVEMTYEQAIVNEELVYPVCDVDSVTTETLLFAKQADSASITFIVKEINFVEDDINKAIKVNKAVDKELTANGFKDTYENTNIKPVWTAGEETDTYIGVINFTEEGDYQVVVDYTDRSGNQMAKYTSPVFVVDYTAPKFILTASTGSDYYSQEKTATIAVEERAFRPSEFSFTFLNGEDQPDGSNASEEADARIKDKNSWLYDTETKRYYINFDFKETGTYKFKVSGKDVAGNDSGEGATTEFVIDLEAPKDLEISYEYSKLDSVINTVTFGYYNPEVKVNLTAYDELSGVHQFDWVYTAEEGASNVNVSSESGTIKDLAYSNEGRTATGSFYLSAQAAQSQYRGNISFTATDRVGNKSEQFNDASYVVVVDTISPTREVEFSTAKQVVSKEALSTVENYNYVSENGDVQLIYDGAATATLRITEANFYPEDVTVTVNDTAAAVNDWSNSGDVWTGNLTFSEDGHYIVKISYIDRSTNQMIEYVSNEVIVDTVAPVIKVTYSPDNSVNTKDENIYYGEKQTATITITEHNFRASDVVAVITATDIAGSDISVEDFAAYLKNPNNWTSNGDNHTATITFSADANYTFDIDYTDLALHAAEDYQPDSFTVDTTPPESLSISYSSSLFDTVVNAVTFNYYNAPVTVTVSADDDVSGVGEFVYTYENSFGGNGEQVISESSINYSNSGMTAKADFVIPEQALASGNQFNGSVDFYATDRSNNKSETLDDSTMLVADNIAPQATITYNEPVSSNDSGSYYAGDITATITITEDNFYEEDVEVKVNGELRNPTNWSNKGNVWTGTVVISADGDYTVSVDYTDRSENTMTAYESERLTIDRESPKVYVSDVKNESASNEENISFVIRAEDTNFNPSEFKPMLTAVILNSSGKFETRNIAIGAVQTVEAGKVYTVNSGNIELDGVYTLTCSVTDMSGNSTTTMIATDSGSTALNQLRFSVNRNGSTFMLDEYTGKAVSQYYIGEVKQNIVIEEINVDPLKEYKVELNGKVLVEGEDYTVTKSGSDWNRYTYSVNAALFDAEGAYSLVVTSVDGTETMSYSDLKNAEIRFVVDKTAPVVTVAGLEQNGRYQTEKQLVTIIPSDDGGNLYSLKVVIKDENGNVIDTPFNHEGEELAALLETSDGKLTFEIKEGVYQDVDIICTDMAGNEYVSGETFYNVTVSPSGWVILWANPVFRIGLLSGAGILVLGLFLIIFLKKRKKDEKNK